MAKLAAVSIGMLAMLCPAATFATVIPRNVRLSEAPSHGKPVIFYDITSRGAVGYLELAREIIGREGKNG